MAEKMELVDPYTLPIEELRQKAAEEIEKPRDEQGKFIKVDHGDELGAPVVEAVVEEPVVEPEPEQFIVRREVDLGDGSGIQIFKGLGASKMEALEDLNDKFVEAQRHATKKIREQEARLREQQASVKQSTEDEDFVLGQKFKDNPAQAVKDLLRQERESQARQMAEQQAAVEKSLQAQQDFVNAHPEYIASAANGNRLRAWAQTHGYAEFTEENLEKAFNDLSSSGLLELKSEEADEATNADERQVERIAQPRTEAAQPRGTKRSSTVKGGASPTVKAGTSESELERLSTEELAAKTREYFRQAAQGQS